MTVNYQRELENQLKAIKNSQRTQKLLLHSCCGPCSSYVLEYLSQYFKITVYYYNPNIFPPQEYYRRKDEQEELINKLNTENKITFMQADYNQNDFYTIAKGLEAVAEGGTRCFACYALRLENAAATAKRLGFDYFTTTLSISPHKNAEKLNEIGYALQKKHDVKYLCADFKKKNGYNRSLELSHKYNLYRQDYCGCEYSIRKEK